MVTLGVDIGQKHDPTALCVAQAVTIRDCWGFRIRWLERLPLGTPYPEVADRIEDLVDQLQNRPEGLKRVYIDATGVGTPVVDALVGRVSPDLLRAVYLTGGRVHRISWQGRYWQIRLGKARLVHRLLGLLQGRCLALPTGAEARALEAELLSYEIRIDTKGHDRYGAFRSGTHDDLVTALALAVQGEPEEG